MKIHEEVAMRLFFSDFPEVLDFKEIQDEYDMRHKHHAIDHPDGFEPADFFEDWYPRTLLKKVEELIKDLESENLC